jgi:hypothetical protein
VRVRKTKGNREVKWDETRNAQLQNWRGGLVMHGKLRWSQLDSRLTACRVLGHQRAEWCDAEQRDNFKKTIFFTCGGLDLYPR